MAETKKTTATKTVKSSETKATATKTAAPKKTTTTKTAPKTTTAKKTTAKAAEVKAEVAVKVEEVKVEAPKAEKKAPASKKANGPMLKVTLVKSGSGRLEKQIRTLKALGLNKTNSSNVVPDNAATRGMIFVVKHLVSVEIVK